MVHTGVLERKMRADHITPSEELSSETMPGTWGL